MNTDLAWCAGIIDGEGTITLSDSGKGSIVPRILLTMTHEATVQRVHSILKIGNVTRPVAKQANHHKQKFSWSLGGAPAILVIRLLYPYLFTKKPQADLAIEYAEKCMLGRGNKASEATKILRQVLADEMRELNKRGE